DTIGAEGILKLMQDQVNRKARFCSCTTYVDEKGELFQFENDFDENKFGTIAEKKSEVACPNAWSDLWFIYKPFGSSKVLAELSDKELSSTFANDKDSFENFVSWFKEFLNKKPKTRIWTIEGLDGVGKSTLCRRFEEHGFLYEHESFDPIIDSADIEHFYLKKYTNKTSDIVYDRSFMSEYAYGLALRGHTRVSEEFVHSLIEKAKTVSDLHFTYLYTDKESLLERRKHIKEDFQMLLRNYNKIMETFAKIVSILERDGCDIQVFNTKALGEQVVFLQTIRQNYFDILYCGNLSCDSIVTVDGKMVERKFGGSALNSAITSRFAADDLKIAIYSAIGSDYDSEVFERYGINKKYIAYYSGLPSLSFFIGEDFCKRKSDYLEYQSAGDVATFVNHLHVSCRVGVPNPLNTIKSFKFKTFSIDLMKYAIDKKFSEIIEILDKKPLFVFCNQEEYNMLSEKLSSDSSLKFKDSMFVVTEKNYVKILKDGKILENIDQSVLPTPNIVSTVGAGDSFIGGFISEFAKRKNLVDCIINGIAIARTSVSDVGVEHVYSKKAMIAETKKILYKQIKHLETIL
ncbi:MAG TPA: PfkB family carbohydrate kinase, partial [Rickettsiales bacterium]|nr:PfkB family carbohydrate kinase [Rickettsiales bacterium]